MPLRGAILGVAAPGTTSSEKRKAAKAKKDKPKSQNAGVETVTRSARSRERCSLPSLPSLHLRISFADFSRRGFGRWSLPRRPGNENIQVVRTKSQAGMHRPIRFPTIYKSNSRLFIDPLETFVAKETARETDPGSMTADYSEKHSVIVDLPERVEMHIASLSTEKHAVVVGIPNALEITLSPRRERGVQGPSRFVELNDDASVHELEAVYPTASTPAGHRQTPTTVVLCEADDPTALPTLDFLQRSFTMRVRQRRPKLSLRTPRSKSLHIMSGNASPNTSGMAGPPSPSSSAALCRSRTQIPAVRYSVIPPHTSIDMPRPMRPYSTISVPLFMEASDLAYTSDEAPPLPSFAEGVAEDQHVPPGEEQSRRPNDESERSITERDVASASSPSPSEEADTEEDGEPTSGMARSLIKKTVADSINKPLPPEPQMVMPTTLPTAAYKPRQIKDVQSLESLPRSRYSPTHVGRSDDFRKPAGVRSPSLDHAIEELEWRLSSMCEQRAGLHGPSPKTAAEASRGLAPMQYSRSPTPVAQRGDGESVSHPRRRIVRSNSANHISLQSRGLYEKKTRSCQDLQRSRGSLELPMAEESETWYKTSSERSSANLSQSVFSDAGTDGTCQTEQSNAQEKGKQKAEPEKENERVICNTELPRAMQSSSVPADVAEIIILRIMSSLTTLRDLFATASLNKGFYKTFKRHEMYLIKCTVFRSSVAAWELRESTEESRVTPAAYLRQHSVEIYTLGMLKSLILVQCESFLRPATIAGLVGTNQIRSAEIDAAFWRVWTFCRLFGSTAGEDEDIEEQIDWLNGGQLARQRDPCTFFGLGNGSGLSKSELYDMIELWTCLSVLVQTFHGRVKEARAAGIYRNCKVDASRDEELLLEEWTWYLLTLGPSCILALAPGSFSTAKDMLMTQWTPPAPGPGSSRSKFFKEALTRAYEDRLDEESRTKGGKAQRASRSSHRLTKSEIARALDRARQTAFAQEIHVQLQQSPGKSEPWTFSDERPMSAYSQVVKSLPHVTSQISPQDLAAMPKPPAQYTVSMSRVGSRKSSKRSGQTTPARPQTPVLTSSSAVPTPDDDLPVSSNGIEAATLPRITVAEIRNENVVIVDPTDRAMTHLVDVLGFNKEHAKWALTRSENGHGIDIEKAIDMLVSGSSQSPQASSREGVHFAVEVDSSPAQRTTRRRRTPATLLQRDSMFTTDEMTDQEKVRENKMRMKEKSYRVLGIGTPSPGGRFGSVIGKRFSRR